MQNLELKHLDQASISQTQLTIDALARIAPSCITEVKDSKTGSIKHAVDFKVLRQLLGDNAVEDAPEAYEFTWVGKQEARREAAKSIHKTLRPVPEDSVDWDNTQNIYIEGDNLEALKLLQKSYLGKVKMIYIDPPYNTGSDFVYHDDFKVGQNEYDEKAGNVDEEGNRLVSRGDNDLDDVFLKNTDTNGRFHSDWCSMIYSRLMIARSLLTEDGVIFISIDDNEVENLRKICDEVFGEGNFIGCITIKSNPRGSMSSAELANLHEYILLYTKCRDNANIIGHKLSNEMVKEYKFKDQNGSYRLLGLRMRGGFWRRTDRPNLYFPIYVNPSTTQVSLIKDNNHNIEVFPIQPSTNEDGTWRWSKEKISSNLDLLLGKIVVREGKEEWDICQKDYYNKYEIRRTKAKSIWDEGEINYQNGTVCVKDLLGKSGIFEYSKPTFLIRKSCNMIDIKDDDIILDFFSGSATTAHAVMQLNAEDGGNRRFIMVQLPEETAEDSEARKAGYKNICEIGKERIRRAGKKIKEELLAKQGNGQSAKEQSSNGIKQGGLFDNTAHTNDSENTNNANVGNVASSTLDTGFRVFRIDSGNMKDDLEQAPAAVEQTKLDFYLDNVKDDRTELDLLFGCMLNWGVQLSLPMSKETVDGCNIYTVNDGDLVACLTKDQPITENIVKAIAEKSPLRVLFRDGSFASDASKINIFEQFKQLMDWSDDEIVKNVRVL